MAAAAAAADGGAALPLLVFWSAKVQLDSSNTHALMAPSAQACAGMRRAVEREKYEDTLVAHGTEASPLCAHDITAIWLRRITRDKKESPLKIHFLVTPH
jgi:hypothetical protein